MRPRKPIVTGHAHDELPYDFSDAWPRPEARSRRLSRRSRARVPPADLGVADGSMDFLHAILGPGHGKHAAHPHRPLHVRKTGKVRASHAAAVPDVTPPGVGGAKHMSKILQASAGLELLGQLVHAGLRQVAIRIGRARHGGPTGRHEHLATLVAALVLQTRESGYDVWILCSIAPRRPEPAPRRPQGGPDRPLFPLPSCQLPSRPREPGDRDRHSPGNSAIDRRLQPFRKIHRNFLPMGKYIPSIYLGDA